MVMSEMLRVLKKGSKIELVVPGPTNLGYRDIDHVKYFNEGTFKCLHKTFCIELKECVTNSRGDIYALIKKMS